MASIWCKLAPESVANLAATAAKRLPRLTFLRLHVAYFTALIVLGAVIIWLLERDNIQCSFVDALFTSASASTQTGLTVLDTANVLASTQVTLLVLMLLGSTTLCSASVPALRRYYMIRAAHQELSSPEQALQASDEYAALGFMTCVALVYPALVIVPTFLIVGSVVATNTEGTGTVVHSMGLSPWWFSLFHATSSFCNAGFALHTLNLVPFHADLGVLLPLAFAIMLGNTCYPISLWCLMWAVNGMYGGRYRAAAFALSKPRRVFTHLFRAGPTRVLAYLVFALIVLEVASFLGLNYNRPFLSTYTAETRVLIAFFQGVSTRTAGFNVVELTSMAVSMQLVYASLMFISNYPIIVSMRASMDPKPKETKKPDAASAHEGANSMDASLGRQRNEQVVAHDGSHVSDGHPDKRRMVTTDKERSGDGRVSNSESVYDSVDGKEQVQPFVGVESRDSSDPSATSNGHAGVPLDRQDSFIEVPSVPDPATTKAGFHAQSSPEIALGTQIRRVLAQEIPILVIALFAIAVAQTDALEAAGEAGPHYNLWAIIFELISAFGTVGVSLGYPGTVVSLSAQFSTFSKLVVVIIMFLGRHRALPVDIDPSIKLGEREEEAPVSIPRAILAAISHTGATIGTMVGATMHLPRSQTPQAQTELQPSSPSRSKGDVMRTAHSQTEPPKRTLRRLYGSLQQRASPGRQDPHTSATPTGGGTTRAGSPARDRAPPSNRRGPAAEQAGVDNGPELGSAGDDDKRLSAVRIELGRLGVPPPPAS